MDYEVAALLVTYNRKNLLKTALESLINQTKKLSKIIVVDNASTDGTKEFLQGYSERHKEIEHLRLEENIGGAGGFYIGLKKLVCDGKYDWIWMMDDDAVPSRNALETLLSFYESLPERTRRKIGVLQNRRVHDRDWFERNDGKHFPLRGRKRYFGTFVGFLVKTSVVERVGFPRRDFFIYGDDVEYGFRIRKSGFEMLTIDGSYIYHPNWSTPLQYFFMKRKLIEKGIIKIQPWRYYYVFRNGLLMFQNPLIKFLVILYQLVDLASWRLIDEETYRFALRGMKDGLKGISGRMVEPGERIA